MLTDPKKPPTTADIKSSAIRRLRYVALTAIVVGCAGTDTSGLPSDLSYGGYGNPQGGLPGAAGQQGIPPAPPTCGNGVVDPGEACEGEGTPTSATCASETMGARPVGTVVCTHCYFDATGCTASGQPGGAGTGPLGVGGSGGQFGGPPTGNGGAPSFGNGGTPQFGNGGTPPVGNAGTPPVGNGGTPPVSPGGGPTQLPTAANCPTFTNGGVVQIPRASGTNVPVTIYIDPAAKSKPAPGGPLVIYWHATLSSPAEVHQGFGDTNIQKVTAAGGVVAAPATTACSGCTTTDDGYWFVEDDVVLDTIVACAIKEATIDTTHIHTLGWSAGGLHTTHVAQARSAYIASFISYSGGLYPLPSTDQDPSNHVAGILTYGDSGSDVVVLDFNQTSHSWYTKFQPLGWYSMMCHHPGGHEIDPQVAPLSLRFFMDHPYKVSPEPYASGVPSGYPTYCSNQAN